MNGDFILKQIYQKKVQDDLVKRVEQQRQQQIDQDYKRIYVDEEGAKMPIEATMNRNTYKTTNRIEKVLDRRYRDTLENYYKGLDQSILEKQEIRKQKIEEQKRSDSSFVTNAHEISHFEEKQKMERKKHINKLMSKVWQEQSRMTSVQRSLMKKEGFAI